jgi:type II secretory pathway pseudopilin PulG
MIGAKFMLNNKGYTLVELLLVMMLLLVFGVTIFTLIYSGSETYQRISNNRNAESDARIALSYLNVKLRQHDYAEGLDVKPFPGTDRDALVLYDQTLDGNLETWIFWSEGQLLECLISEGETPDVNLSFTIVDIENFEIAYDRQTRVVTGAVTYTYNGRSLNRSCAVTLRSKEGGETAA